MVFTAEEQQLWDSAVAFAKGNKKAIARKLTCTAGMAHSGNLS
ncbi:hypothetical protein [Pseudomonas putida]|nr:hypothetical protein [Pseudomonas putida]